MAPKDKDGKDDKKEKKKSFEDTLKKLKKDMPGSVWFNEKKTYLPDVQRIGLPSIDFALGIGGIPQRRIIELYGPEASGKTTLCLLIIAEVQKRGGKVVFIDAENSLDPVWAKKLGVNFKKMAILQQDDAPTVLNAVREIVQTNDCDLFVVDSVAALVTRKELEGEMEDQQVGEQARLMSKLMRIINVDLMKTNTIAIFTNQLRDKIGVKYGDPTVTPGGKALKFYASIRLDVKKASDDDAYKAGEHVAKVRVAKNKLAPPFGIGYFRIGPNGVIRAASLIEPAVEMGVIKHAKSGKKYEYNGKEWTGEARLLTALRNDDALCQEIMDATYKKFEEKANDPTPVPEAVDEPEEPDLENENDETEENSEESNPEE